MAEYIDIDAPVVVTDTRGRERETTVRHILEMNKGVYTAADVRPVVRGKWMWELADNGWANHICSVCGYTKNTDIHVRMDYNFCPNCGAMMEEI